MENCYIITIDYLHDGSEISSVHSTEETALDKAIAIALANVNNFDNQFKKIRKYTKCPTLSLQLKRDLISDFNTIHSSMRIGVTEFKIED